MKSNDIERVFHQTYLSDKGARPLLGKLSGPFEIGAFVGSIVLAVVWFRFLTGALDVATLPSLTVGLFPLTVYAVLSRFVSGKPADYVSCWLEYRRLRRTQSPLLSGAQNHED